MFLYENIKRLKNDTPRKVYQRREVYKEFISQESLRRDICMQLFRSYAQTLYFPRADHVLAHRRASRIIREIAFDPALLLSTRMPLNYYG